MIRIVKQRILCYGDASWYRLWEEIIQQSCSEIILLFCETEEQLKKFWEEKSALACMYTVNDHCVFEDWVFVKKFYLLPEFFLVFLGNLKVFQERVGYVLEDFSFYHNIIFTKRKNFLLREKEYKILLYFLHRYQEKISKEELLKGIWSYNREVETLTLETHVGQLNKKLRFCNHRITKERDFFYLILLGRGEIINF
ncbi:DNA-binding transcriptional regulator BasR [Holospora elegans E1]|uniref:DNA-binding transcriptional regulator BasR n=1 Tax=Holospora elegans E1 TaxID=1427503 RepID=A0A023DZM4_9PROT|nr:helix-turn-helix domain-containing protein [Holospora elegans]GAJ46543.1 DNA-binding transcriptional regulator BasR [Holospora elegans E1]